VKSILAISFALVMLFKPLWPLAEYIANYDNIVNNLCKNRDKPAMKCNGKCYLAELLAKENGKPEKNPFESPRIQYTLTEVLFPMQAYTLPAFNGGIEDARLAIAYREKLNPALGVRKRYTPPKA